jgi:hypothetical protein
LSFSQEVTYVLPARDGYSARDGSDRRL